MYNTLIHNLKNSINCLQDFMSCHTIVDQNDENNEFVEECFDAIKIDLALLIEKIKENQDD